MKTTSNEQLTIPKMKQKMLTKKEEDQGDQKFILRMEMRDSLLNNLHNP